MADARSLQAISSFYSGTLFERFREYIAPTQPYLRTLAYDHLIRTTKLPTFPNRYQDWSSILCADHISFSEKIISMLMRILSNIRWFTLFELVISMTLFAIIMIAVFDSVANIGISRVKNVQRVSLLEELYFFSEKLATTIKEWGTVDYEEYWNRTISGTGTASGHYISPTYFWNYGSWGIASIWVWNNFGSGQYFCRSKNGSLMGTGGCLKDYNSFNDWSNPDTNYSWTSQRFGEYRMQFTDYNGNQDSDAPYVPGDEDGVGGIIWDDDDIELGDGPPVIANPMAELYLINTLKKKRVYFRWNYKVDPNAPSWVTCDMTTGSGCLGNIQIFRMDGKDLGKDHDGSLGNGAFDGNIDTWVCDQDWRCAGKVLPGYGTLSFNNDTDWIDIFPDYINVKSLRFYIYPIKNPWYAWKAVDDVSGTPGFLSPFIHPYVKIQITLGFWWKRRSIIKNDDPTITISTTINLEDLWSE